VEQIPAFAVSDHADIRFHHMTGRYDRSCSQLVSSPPGAGNARPACDAQRDTVQPAGHRVAATDRPSPPRQDEKRGLGSLFRVVLVSQYVAADAQNQRSMPVDEGRERGLGNVFAPLDEAFEQLGVGESCRRAGAKQTVDLFEELHFPTASMKGYRLKIAPLVPH
jgi:hypothetical protein